MTWPRSDGAASSSVALWPRSAARRAASRPPTPPPITSTRLASCAGWISDSSASRPIIGFCTQVIDLPMRRRPMQPSLAPTQVRMSSSRPSIAFFGISGSAIIARVMPTRSHTPEASTVSACSGAARSPSRAERVPFLDPAAVFIGARVGEGGEKVLQQVTAVEGNVAAVVATLLEPHGGGGPAVDHLADLGLGHDVRPLAVALFPGVGRTPQGRARVPGMAAAAAVGDLREAERAVAVDGRAHLLELRDDAVVPVVDLGPVVHRGGMDARGAEHHHRPAAALGLLLVVADVAVGEAAALAVGRAVRGGDDAVLGRGVAQLDGAQQMTERVGHDGYFSLAS